MSHKTVWITGASSGIGREFVCRYAKLGFRLILTARRRERLDQLAAELLAKYNTFCRVLPADLARESECTRLCEELAEERIDIFINNAGFGVCGSFLETSTEAELSMAKVNVLAMHQLCKFAVQKMQAQGFGTVLNVASSAGLLPGGPYMAGYYATTALSTSAPSAPARWTPSSMTGPVWCSPSRAFPPPSVWRKPCAGCCGARPSSCPRP